MGIDWDPSGDEDFEWILSDNRPALIAEREHRSRTYADMTEFSQGVARLCATELGLPVEEWVELYQRLGRRPGRGDVVINAVTSDQDALLAAINAHQ